MRAIRLLSIACVSAGAVACTSILGDFSNGSSTADGGTPQEGGPAGDGATDGPLGDGAPGTVSVTPDSARIGILRSQAFAATQAVTWSVKEGATGGSIDSTGKYISPAAPGVYHVIATSKANASATQTIAVTVVALDLSIAGGIEGGSGNVDGPVKYAHLDGPQGVAYVGNGMNLVIVADTENDTIRKLDRSTNKVTTLAGTPGVTGTTDGTGVAAQFNYPTSLLANDGTFVWVNDTSNNCLRKVNVGTGAVTTFSGTCGSAASTVDGTGWSNGVAGTAMFGPINSMTIGPDGAIYTCEINNNTFRGIRRVDINTGDATTIISGLNGGCEMAGDDYNQRIYFNDNPNSRDIRMFPVPTSGFVANPTISSLVVLPGGEGYTRGMASLTGYGNENDIYTIDLQGAAIDHFRIGSASYDTVPFSGSTTMTGTTDGPAASALFENPSAVWGYSPGGYFFVADSSANDIREINVNGSPATVTTVMGVPTVGGRVDGALGVGRLTGPAALATDSAGNIYVGDVGGGSNEPNDTIRKIDASGTISTFAGAPSAQATVPMDGTATTATFGLPFDMTMLGDTLYVADLQGNAIRAVDKTGGVTTPFGVLGTAGKMDGQGGGAEFSFYDTTSTPIVLGAGITTDGTNLYVADTGNFAIREIVISTGMVSTIAGGMMGTTNAVGTMAKFLEPISVAYDAGQLYIADTQDNVIRVMDLTTMAVTTLVGLSGTAGEVNGDASMATFTSPIRLVADHIGNLYVTELNLLGNGATPGTIRRIDLSGPTVSTFAGVQGSYGVVPGPLPATMNEPFGLALTPTGDLLVGDIREEIVGLISAP